MRRTGIKSIVSDLMTTGLCGNNALNSRRLRVEADILPCPAGPIINWEHKNVVEAFCGRNYEQAQEDACVFVRVRPQLALE